MREKHTWTTKTGDVLLISRMETRHIENTIKLIERNAKIGVEIVTSYGYDGDDDFMTGDVECVVGEDYLQRVEEYQWLKDELHKRKSI